MKKVKVLRHSNGAQDIKKRPTTAADFSSRREPPRTIRNVRRGHLIKAMRDINHIEWEAWEQEVARMQRMMEWRTMDKNNRSNPVLRSHTTG